MKNSSQNRHRRLLAIPVVFALLFLGALLKDRSEKNTSNLEQKTKIMYPTDCSHFIWNNQEDTTVIKGISIKQTPDFFGTKKSSNIEIPYK